MLTQPPNSSMLATCPGRPGAAGLCELRQVREEAAISERSRVPPVSCPDIFI